MLQVLSLFLILDSYKVSIGACGRMCLSSHWSSSEFYYFKIMISVWVLLCVLGATKAVLPLEPTVSLACQCRSETAVLSMHLHRWQQETELIFWESKIIQTVVESRKWRRVMRQLTDFSWSLCQWYFCLEAIGYHPVTNCHQCCGHRFWRELTVCIAVTLPVSREHLYK